MGERRTLRRCGYRNSVRDTPCIGSIVESVASEWIDTPWRAGQRRKGYGVDCTNYVTAVLDTLLGVPPTLLPRYTQDAAHHAGSQGAFAAAYKACSEVHRLNTIHPDDDGHIELNPGDVIVVRVNGRGDAGHVMIVGGAKRSAYHADQAARRVILAAIPPVDRILHIWRSERRPEWAEVAKRG